MFPLPERFFLFYIGSTKMCGAQVKKEDNTFFEVLRFNEIQPSGIEKGNVVQLEHAMQDIRHLKSGIGSSKEFLRFPTYVVLESALTSTYSLNTSLYFNKLKKIRFSDVQKVIQQTKDVATLPLSEQIIFSIPQSFKVNDLEGIENPIGLDGARLAVDLLIGSMNEENWKRFHQVFQKNGIDIENIFSKDICGGFGAMTQDERKGSTLYLDIGGDLTSLVYFRNKNVRRTSWMSFGGESFTQRIQDGLGVTKKEANYIKEHFGTVQHHEDVFHDEIIPRTFSPENSTATLTELTQKQLHPILINGLNDFMELIQVELDRIESLETKVEQIVVSGGGARLEGLLESFYKFYDRPVRLTQPSRIRTRDQSLIQPEYAAFFGALRFISEQNSQEKALFSGDLLPLRVFKTIKTFIRKYF